MLCCSLMYIADKWFLLLERFSKNIYEFPFEHFVREARENTTEWMFIALEVTGMRHYFIASIISFSMTFRMSEKSAQMVPAVTHNG